jgi:hypothetical protein
MFHADERTENRQTDTTNLRVASRNFINALKNGKCKGVMEK